MAHILRQPAVVLSGNPNALGVVRALGEQGIPVVVIHYAPYDIAQRSKYASVSIAAPHPEKDPERFLSLLLEHAQEWAGGVIFPTADETVVFASRHKGLLEKYFKVACPFWDIAERYIEKRQTYALANACGVPVPQTLVPQNDEEIVEFARRIEFPCLVKPSEGHLYFAHFKRKMTSVANPEELLVAYREARDAGFEVMLQEYIPGNDDTVVNYNAYFVDGQAKAEFTSRHTRNAPPWFGSPRVACSERIPEVIEPGRKILQALDFNGYACTEFKYDHRDGLFKLMEVNGRHNLSTLLAVRCGLNFPLLHYRHLAFGDEPRAEGYEEGRYWIDLVRDIGFSLTYRSQEPYRLIDYLRPYLHRPVFAILSLRDPMPFWARMMFIMHKTFQKAEDSTVPGTR
jgi:predicted ATP-grasp superfamily ATP-dependent carboligase